MALEGTLEDMSLPDLFQIFRTGSKSGLLLLTDDTRRGVIYVAQGRLLDALVVRGPDRHVLAVGEEAAIQLLLWEDASFTFRHDLATNERPARIDHDSEWLILESFRRRTSPPDPRHQSVTLDTRLMLSALPASAESGVNLNLDQWRILSQIAISEQVRDICTSTNMEPAQVMRTVSELLAIGLVEVAVPRYAPSRSAAPRHAPPQTAVLTPALAGVGALGSTVGTVAASGSGLVHAIMRRLRGL